MTASYPRLHTLQPDVKNKSYLVQNLHLLVRKKSAR
jgi:hypothetical protein